MIRVRKILVALVGVVIAAPTVHAQAEPVALRWAPYTLQLTDEKRIPAEQAALTVPERRGAAEERRITLNLIRLRGRGAAGRPILYLAGAPAGIASSEALRIAPYFPFFDRLREAGDVIVMDYRGSGLSRPRLTCPPPAAYPADAFSNRERALAFFMAQAHTCFAQLRADGVDIAGYTWREVAHDVNDVRAALGVPSVDLFGFSAGTHASLAAVREHPAAVGRVVLLGTEGPDHTRKLPSAMDRQLGRVAQLIRADRALSREVPDFVGLVRQVLDGLGRKPIEVEVKLPGNSGSLRGPVGRFALEFITARSLSGPEEFDTLPRLYFTLSRGDTSVLTKVMQRIVDRSSPGPLAHVIDGASGVSEARRARIVKEAETSLLGDAANFPFPEIRAAWQYPDLGPEFRAAVRSNVPALFLTGELDGNTPPAQAEEVRGGFPNGVHLVITNAGHGSAFASADVASTIVAFLRGQDVSARRLSMPEPRLASLRR